LAALLVLFAGIWIPTIPRATENPQYLSSFINDEPMITQQLVGMMLPPYGNPANLLDHPERRASYWGGICYPGVVYYGGAYLEAAFIFFAPLKLLGLADFPTAPIILRSVALLASLFCLMLVYNLAKRSAGRWAGLIAALLLMVDANFNYYTSIIHPDTMLIACGLLALWAAIGHAETGRLRSLIALGFAVGLAQGTKMGGPWIVPLALLAFYLGSKHVVDKGPTAWRWYGRRLTWLGLAALVAYVLSTPYAFFDHYYFKSWKETWKAYRLLEIVPVSIWSWVEALLVYQGRWLNGLLFVSLVLAGYRWWHHRTAATLLTIVLYLSVLVWHIGTVRIWITTAYLVPGSALAGVIIGVETVGALRSLHVYSRWGQKMGLAALATALAVLIQAKGSYALVLALLDYCPDRYPTVQVGRWAEKHLDPNCCILYDDIAYFDPTVFSRAVMHRGLLSYEELEKVRPDYFIICGSIYQSTQYAELRKTQHYSRDHEGPASVLLYQDLLDRGGIPEAELVAEFTPTGFRTQGEFLKALLQAAVGRSDHLFGTELKLYRYHPERAHNQGATRVAVSRGAQSDQ
jgi:hypothetical protein